MGASYESRTKSQATQVDFDTQKRECATAGSQEPMAIKEIAEIIISLSQQNKFVILLV
jgi:hypothetical protein